MKQKLTFPSFVLAILASVAILSGWLGSRDLSRGEALAIYADSSGLSAQVLTYSAYLGIFLCLGYLLTRLPRLGRVKKNPILLYFAIYYLTTVICPFILSDNHYIKPGYFFPIIVIFAVLLAPRITPLQLSWWARISLGALIFSSLLGALIAPEKSIASDYSGIGAWIPFRLYGIGMGATGLGAVSVAFLIFELNEKRWTLAKLIRLAMAVTALILSQSKTAWIAFTYLSAGYLLTGLMAMLKLPAVQIKRARVLLFAGFLCFSIIFLIIIAQGEAGLQFNGAESIETLTGRLYIWRVTIGIWLNHPLFGYGLGLWADDNFRAIYGGFRHAHNQFIQALGSAGIIGLAGLLLYFMAISRMALNRTSESAVPLDLSALLIISSLTDVPLLNISINDTFFILHVLVLLASTIENTTARKEASNAQIHKLGARNEIGRSHYKSQQARKDPTVS